MTDDECELKAQDEKIANLLGRFAAISANAAAVAAKELFADLSLAKARIQSLTADLERLRDARPDRITSMAGWAQSVDKWRRSMGEIDRSLCGLESLLRDRISNRPAERFNREGL